ncbi:hypothetical protein EMMF5_000654 [Cystobasidiomycetes sp. EMM_F5]
MPTANIEIEVITHLTEDEKEYISAYMARAFDRTDPESYVATGKLYEEDPLSHKLFFRSIIDRTILAGGLFTTSKDRNVFATRWLPGVAMKTLDLDWRSGNDDNLDTWVARCGGTAHVKDRLERFYGPGRKESDRVYGPNGSLKHLRGNWLGCNPDFQQNGYARAVHESNIREANKLGRKVLFGSCRKNVPIYKRIGGRPVGNEVEIEYPLPAQYSKDWQYVQLMESGSDGRNSKL